MIHLALEHEVLILCLPPHTTHATQPLDCGVFSPFKAQWSTVCHEFIQKNPGKVITRFNFNGLFSQAWLKSVNPSNMIAGFKVCGVYPVNRQAVKPNGGTKNNCKSDKQECSKRSESNEFSEKEPAECEDRMSTEHEEIGSTNCLQDKDDEITPELEKKFQLRFEEGYDLCIDPLFTRWLEKNHPESVIRSDPVSIEEEFSYITPLSPLNTELFETNMMVDTDYGEKQSDTTEQADHESDTTEQADHESDTTEQIDHGGKVDQGRIGNNANNRETRNNISSSHKDTENNTSNESREDNASVDIIDKASGVSTENNEPSPGSKNSSALSKVLVDYTPQVTPVSLSKRSKPKARLLTSAECLKMLQEKENKKKQQLEEKERKRKEREEKKRIREEEAKRKKEEKERKAQERAEKAKQKSKVSGQSKNSRKRNISETPQVSNKRRKNSEAVTAEVTVEASSSSIGNESRAVNNSMEEPITSSTGNTLGTVNNSIDVNICCMCFKSYENDVLERNGAEWIDCACGRWLHLDCAEDCVEDSFGKQRYCPYCIGVSGISGMEHWNGMVEWNAGME